MNFALNDVELPIRLRTENAMSDDEFMRFCAANEPARCERDANGEIIVMSPTGTGGGRVESRVYLELGIWAREDARGEAFGSTTGFKLPDTSVRAADAAWASFRRLDSLSESDLEGYAPICPEFVIEIRSKSDSLRELQAKMEQWMANGAEVAWLIDPLEKAITVYRPGVEPEHHVNPSSVQGTGPVAGFELVLARVWARPHESADELTGS